MHPGLCDPTDCSTPGFPVRHCLLEFAQTHAHWVGDAIQPCHPLTPLVSSCPQSFPVSGSFHPIRCYRASQLTQGWRICLPTQHTQVWSLGSGDSSGEGNGSPLQFSCLGNPMDRGAWWAIVHGVTKSHIWLKRLRKHTLGAIRNCFQAKVSGIEKHYLHNVMTKLHQKKWWCLTQVFTFIMQKNNSSSPMGINIRGNWIQKSGGEGGAGIKNH